MPIFSWFTRRRARAFTRIIFRNAFLLINGIILVVVVLLAVFGDMQEGIFLGLITLVNIVLGAAQEISAWMALEKLQLLTSPRVSKVMADGSTCVVLVEEVFEKDRIALKMGDQVPCDSIVVSSHGFEVNEAMVTGEATVFMKKVGEPILAGSIVTSGSGVLEVQKTFAESRVSIMTKSISKYYFEQSPIQSSINLVIKYTSYLLLAVIVVVVARGLLLHVPSITVIQNVGALTSALLPQGMLVIITLLFSYGTSHLYRRNILLQEINATEKIGRIKNLCMDKTGTLTSSELIVEGLFSAPQVSQTYAKSSVAAYIAGTGDPSQTIETVKKTELGSYTSEIMDFITFSSGRQFGAVLLRESSGMRVVFAGGPDLFLPHMADSEGRVWIQSYIDTQAKIGKRLLCFAEAHLDTLPDDLSRVQVTPVAMIVLTNVLREGVVDAVRFFKDRGVALRIITGDSPETAAAVAGAVGVPHADAVVTGAELDGWSAADYETKVSAYTIFARVKPEQKEKIIEGLKRDGFTAMIGDGANDALAIKRADLGIAMFDGAQATRQLAAVVLVKNSFTDLPGGVKLADSIIQNIEIVASLFFNQVFLGFFVFVALTCLGQSFPFTPLNVTFINYFTVGIPGSLIFYWIVQPQQTQLQKRDTSFLKRVLPFAVVSAVPQAIVAVAAFYASAEMNSGHMPSSLVILAFVAMGVIFFMFTPSVYSGPATKTQKEQFALLSVFEIICFSVAIQIPFIALFYNLRVPSMHSIIEILPAIAAYAVVQYVITKWWFARA